MPHATDCQHCDGEGNVWNNADPTSGQRIDCPFMDKPMPTQGPWFVRNIGVLSVVAMEDNPVICHMTALRDYGDDSLEIMANARLIAAAPDLLEALQLAIPANVCLTNTNIPDSMIVPLDVPMGDLRKIAAAIAKATRGAA